MRTTLVTVALAVATTSACDCGVQPTASAPPAQEEPRSQGAHEPLAAAPREPEEAWDLELDGLRIRRLDSGAIELHGADKWGGRLDTIYESPVYLKNALPVLERSLTPEQYAPLADWAESLEG